MKLKGKNVAVLGYGIEGKDLFNYLSAYTASVKILDKKEDINYLRDLEKFDIIFRSPGVYRYLPEILEVEKNGVEVSSAIKLFFDLCPAKIIGVTGTKGKGTTSTLIYEIFKEAGKNVYLAGNIGKPYLGLLKKLNKESFVILELSSFQLIDLDKSPNIAVVLNIGQDHLDWHKNVDEYIEAKKNIIRYQAVADFALINEEYESSKSFAKETKAKVVHFSKSKLEEKYKKGLLLKGEHNLENVAAAVAAAKILEIDDKIIIPVLQSFKGLEHRLELVQTINGVTFYNDSFATGPQPTIAAIRAFTEPETLILGGSEKGLDYKGLGEAAVAQKNLKNIILIGAVREKIRGALLSAGFEGKIVDLDLKPMTEIVKAALEITPKGGAVLLSPAAASFDMFKDYKDRGKQFKEAVLALN